MHILFVANYSPPYGGGIQFVIASLSRRILGQGHSVTILAADTGIPRGRSTWQGATLLGVPASNVLERRSVPYPLFHPAALWRALGEALSQADAVHVHGLLYLSSVAAAWWARRRGLPVILTEHVGVVPYKSQALLLMQRLAMGTLGRFCLNQCDVVVVLNERVASELRPLLPEATPLVKIPNGVDKGIFRPPDNRPELRERLGVTGPTVLFAGRVVEKKGIDLVLHAARLLPELAFVICGQDSETLSDTPANVRVVGKVDQATLAKWYGAADVLLLPSEGEGFPLVVQEALACGLPVMVTDDATNREYLSEEVAVFVPRDGERIAVALRRLFAMSEHLAAMRRPASQAAARFDWEQTVAAYLRLYAGQDPSTAISSG
ncbi:MAG: glycosyltransferase family 4 protein [Chloroflexi bacterium]|nr:glycosyltransferase family 4 protein [Chloroflexota bacterium]